LGKLYSNAIFALPKREHSSAGLEHLPYKQRVRGSNPCAPTKNPPFGGFLSYQPFMNIFMAIATFLSHLPPYQGALRPEQDKETDVLELVDKGYRLIVWNDEVNTFEWVIETLIDICGHERIQAEQCAWLIHLRGKYAVKNGDYETLKPMCDAITDRGIGATIESVA